MGNGITIQDHSGVCEIGFTDPKIVNEELIKQIDSEFQRVAQSCNYRLFLNFANVQYISSALISKIASLNKDTTTRRDRPLLACNIVPNILGVLILTQFHKVITIVGSVEEALAQLQSEMTSTSNPT